ncbi:MAG: Crp/Fnr family transcriptional regulator [Clostridia bacterium]|nr:Crp/Fnr family transcriptional regulator [Clostridia bacterium]
MDCFLFEGLTADEKATARGFLGEPVLLQKGSELYKSGHIGFMLSGIAAIKRCNKDRQVTMRNLKSGDIFGSASLFGEWDNDLSHIIACEKCEVCYLSEADLRALALKLPQVAFTYIAYLTDRIRFLNRKIDAFTAGSAESKLYEFLQGLPCENGVITVEFGMAELARRLKIGRTSLYRGLEALEKDGLIERNGHRFTLK